MPRSMDFPVFPGLDPDPRMVAEARGALARLPHAQYLMASAFESKRVGVLVRSLQVVADEPLLLGVALRKGHPIEPIVRDSHCFTIGVIEPDDKLMLRKFGESAGLADLGDPFDCLPVETLVTGAPLVKRCPVVFDCVVVRHLDLEADHEFYVGQVFAGRVYREPPGNMFVPPFYTRGGEAAPSDPLPMDETIIQRSSARSA